MNQHQKAEIESYLAGKLPDADFAQVKDMLDRASHIHAGATCSTMHEFAAIPLGLRLQLLDQHNARPRMNDGRRP